MQQNELRALAMATNVAADRTRAARLDRGGVRFRNQSATGVLMFFDALSALLIGGGRMWKH